MTEPAVLTIPEVAVILKRSEDQVKRWLQRGHLPGRKVAGTWYVRHDEMA